MAIALAEQKDYFIDVPRIQENYTRTRVLPIQYITQHIERYQPFDSNVETAIHRRLWSAISSRKELHGSVLIGSTIFTEHPDSILSSIASTAFAYNGELLRETTIIKRNEAAIESFLTTHPEVKTYMSVAGEIIPQYFPDGQLEAELVYDPELDSGSDGVLFLYIRTGISPEEALHQLKKVDQKIFDELNFNSRFFNINIEF